MTRTIDEQTEAAEERWKKAWAKGPTRLRWATMPPQIGDPAPDATLADHDDKAVLVSSLWAQRPLLLLFWRHFGCSCGIDRAARLRAELEGYRDAGGDVAIVGQGEPLRAARYRTLHTLDVPILSDPDLSLYQAFGLLHGTPAQVLFDAPDEFLRCELEAGLGMSAARHGTDRASVDDPWQLPGEFVIGTDGVIRLAHRYGWCEDYPDPRIHVAALRDAAGLL